MTRRVIIPRRVMGEISYLFGKEGSQFIGFEGDLHTILYRGPKRTLKQVLLGKTPAFTADTAFDVSSRDVKR